MMKIFIRRMKRIPKFLLVLPAVFACSSDTGTVGPRADYATVAHALEEFIEAEMLAHELPALSIALVEDQEIVWARGFGFANPDDRLPATAETVYRVGSVSKLFTDIAIMQLVERREIDLDAPVTDYLPDFRPQNPFGREVTLRQMMSHRSGLVREPPVGNYFDPSEPSLSAMVASLNQTKLVYEPETRIKYSNAAVATVGYVLERTRGEAFPSYLKHSVLEPLGMTRSSFEPDKEIIDDLARAYMWTWYGSVFDAPTFELGMAPAGSMYSTVIDLSRFMSALFAGGRGSNGRILQGETLEEMWTPQFADSGQRTGIGIGFNISELDGRRRVSHGGAIYGFATELSALPDERLGAVAITTKDVSDALIGLSVDAALRMMLAVRNGTPLPKIERTPPVPAGLARRLVGRYWSDDGSVAFIERNGRLFVMPGGTAVPLALGLRGDTLIVDDARAYGIRAGVPYGDDAIIIGSDTLVRRNTREPRPAPEQWKGLIGEYGWDHNTLYILERDGKLHALIEWFFQYLLEEISNDVFSFPSYGLYHGEQLAFTRDATGRATRVEAASVVFERRTVGPGDGGVFRIDPIRPVEELRVQALGAEPPAEAGNFRDANLVEVTELDPTIGLDIRYASTDNFMSTVFYEEPRAFLQRPAAEALVRVHRRLREHGYGLLIHDAYRPWYVTKMFWDATPEDKKIFVANPANGSRHNRGCAVDLTLYDLETGEPVQMIGVYDEMSARSYADYPGGTSLQRWHRDLLRQVMEDDGFEVYEFEWWHFDYKAWPHYPILNVTFDQIR